MKTMNEFLWGLGYRLYMCSLDQRYVSFVSEENHCVNVLCLFDERSSTSTSLQMQAFLDAHKGRLDYGRGKDIHFLKLVRTTALGVGRLKPGVDGHGLVEDKEQLEEEDWTQRVWYLIDDADVGAESVHLFVPPAAPEDFYGIRSPLEQQVRESGVAMQLPEINMYDAQRARSEIDRAPAEQGIDGRPVIKRREEAVTAELSWLTLGLVLINALLYILSSMQVFDPDEYALTIGALADPSQWYRLFTYMFLHAGVSHLASNMVMLYAAGSMLEERMKRPAYVMLYLLSGLGGGLLSVLAQQRVGEEYISMGASGAIYGLMGGLIAWMLLNRQWRSPRFFNRILIALLLLFYSSGLDTGIDYMAHLGGFVTGLVITGLYVLCFHPRAGKQSGGNV